MYNYNSYVMRNETREGPNFTKHSNFVDLSDHGVYDFPFEWSKDDGSVSDGVEDEALTWQDCTGSNIVNCCDRNHESILSCARPFHFCKQFLLDRVHKPGAEILRMKKDLMIHANLKITF
jgi:hypothetical protein